MNAINLKNFDDNQLVNLYQGGVSNAMGELYNRYYSLVFSKCLSFTKNVDDAEDFAQDIMIRVMSKLGSFKGESKFSTWLFAITNNYCTDNFRKNKKVKWQPFEQNYDLEDFAESLKEEQLELHTKEIVATAAFDNLAAADRELLTLKYSMNKSIEELQNHYSLSASAIKMRLLRARSKATAEYRNHLLRPAA
ncbi:MAG: sigma-70 family RNA polymerase sigma factor [bacterium]|nr:sigma-70 family RNA polymerase sigma factor [bacterium]